MSWRHIALPAGAIAILVIATLAGMFTAQVDLPTVKDTRPSPQDVVPLDTVPDWRDTPLPDFSQYTVIDERKEAFFDFLFPRIVLANLEVLSLRDYAQTLSERDELTEEELEWLENQSTRLRVIGEPGTEEHFEELIKRFDIISPSLMLAQAANESAWGTSRFAVRGNNLFGQWCFREGCGIVPGQRREGMNHEVEVFETPYRSIRSYLTNLNRHEAYSELREVRAEQREDDQLPDGITLAGGLESYSERGMAYVQEIRSMINFNQLPEYDEAFERVLDADEPVADLRDKVEDYRRRFGEPEETATD